jgi:sugar phosphate permease
MASEVGENEKIQILLAEYNTLRDELIARTGNGVQIGTAIAVIIAAIVTWLLDHSTSWRVYVPSALLVVGVAIFALINIRDTWKAAAEVRALEWQIDRRAGEYLLTHEILSGAARMGFWRGLFSRVRPQSVSTLPPLKPWLPS